MKNSFLEDKTLATCEELFSFAPPEQLHKTIHELFFSWITETPTLPENYKQASEDIYFLLEFLDRMKELKKKQSQYGK
jgi:hypothetical protein